MATQDPCLLILRVLFKQNIKSIGGLLVVLVVDADLSFGHEVADGVLVLDVTKSDLGSAEDLSTHEELN